MQQNDDDVPTSWEVIAEPTPEEELKQYIIEHDGGIRLAGPPTLQGCLANFNRKHPESASVIKKFEHATKKCRPGINAFVAHHNSLFVITGAKDSRKLELITEEVRTTLSTSEHHPPSLISQAAIEATARQCTKKEKVQKCVQELEEMTATMEAMLIKSKSILERFRSM